MKDKIKSIAGSIENKVIEYRRDFHRYAESGWTEYRTASIIAAELAKMGLEPKTGTAVIDSYARMGLPPLNEQKMHYKRALEQGGIKEYMETMKYGYTGATVDIGTGHPPFIGLRFDIDALDIQESQSQLHHPYLSGFASVNSNVMHACGHDAHAAAGLGIALIFSKLREHIRGTVRLIFQPAEEGVRGAKSMVEAKVTKRLNYILGHHIFNSMETGNIITGMSGYAATTKFDATISGEPGHAGGSPESGKNAMLAAAAAITNLYAIPRHSKGFTRINVGRMEAGTGRNVICPHAKMIIETRGENSDLNNYMYNKAIQVIQSAAEMYDCKVDITPMGGADSATTSEPLIPIIEKATIDMGYTPLPEVKKVGGSEDFTYMMKDVQIQGGDAINIGIGARKSGFEGSQDISQAVFRPHTSDFDFDEAAIKTAIEVLCAAVFNLLDN